MTDRERFEVWATTQMDEFGSTRFFNDSCWSAWQASRKQALEEIHGICTELEDHYAAFKDTALLNGDVDLSNAASGEPRACRAIADQIRYLANPEGEQG